jgi:hypothetical protein
MTFFSTIVLGFQIANQRKKEALKNSQVITGGGRAKIL